MPATLPETDGRRMEEGTIMQILRFLPGDVLEMKKKHPCGSTRFRVLRTGSEVQLVCLGCGRDMTMERLKLEKAVKRVDPQAPATEGDR